MNRSAPPFRRLLWLVLCGGLIAGAVRAEEAPSEPVLAAEDQVIEEMVVVGRSYSAATDVVSERLDSDVPVDFLSAEAISRAGDSDVASALRRMPGLTLVDDKFVYVRGLGERYSSAQLNGAAVPSPDLTRNVLPLDIFPADLIDALEVQKGYSPEAPAAFGGGNVNIRGKGAPEDRLFSIKLNTGWNTNSSDDGLTYSGGGDDKWGTDDGTREVSSIITDAVQTYQGSFSPPNILNILNRDGGFHTIGEAEAINRELATALNRNVDLRDKDLPADFEADVAGGYRWFMGDRWEFGFLANANYENKWRNVDRTLRFVANPDTDFTNVQRTVESVNLTGAINLSLRFTDDHEINTSSLYIRNTEDDAAVALTCQQGQFNDCGSDAPTQGRLLDVRFEERELIANQIFGSHKLGDDTLDMLPDFLSFVEIVRDVQFDWYYSDATTRTDLPNEVRVSAVDTLDPVTRQVTSTRIRNSGTAGDFRFSDLEDEVLSYGWDVSLPIFGDGWNLEVSGGYDYTRKARDYTQISMGLGSTAAGFGDIAEGTPSQVFSDDNILNPNNGVSLLLGVGGFGLESYAAGQFTDAYYGKLDFTLDETWRISGGVRYEDFRQISVPLDLLDFDGDRIPLTPDEIADSAILEDEYYPALAVTWMRPNFWAEEFQLRFAYSETVARPDIREVSLSTYIDPLTEARVRGNPMLRPSDLKNYDVRAEWFFDSGDNFTVSLFYKDIDDPIETVQGGATEDNILFNFVNADQAEVYGVEVEWLKNMRFLTGLAGEWVEQFYVAGNVTLSDSEIDITPGIGGVGNITNATREMTQHAPWTVNLQLGFDSFDTRHSGTLVYNVVGERIFFAGVNGFDDAEEQPFHSLDLVYSFFPTENLTLKFRVRNLMDENFEIEQDGVTILEQDVGMTFLFDVKWEL